MWSTAALAAEAADDRPRALMMAAPRCWIVGMNSPSSQAWSLPAAANAGLPPTSAWSTSGYWVAEWLPQIVILVTSLPWTPALAASWAMARLWSRRIMAVNRLGSRSAALLIAIRAFVLAGLPTTRTFTSRFALRLSASPWGLKMPRSEEHTSELQSLMRNSYAVFC